jgi:Raf kinase inhibitor-like YbhB/YbcL family protein
MIKKICLIISVLSFIFLYQYKDRLSSKTGGTIMDIRITSTAFKEGGTIPRKYTCDGSDISPPLAWSSVPRGTKSLALICDDPDAPGKTWVHWVVFNIPADIEALPENVPDQKILSSGAKQGMSDFQKIGYGGPCPPGGTHRYYFKIYALDIKLTSEAGITKAELLKLMKGHILGQGQLMGRYKRQ